MNHKRSLDAQKVPFFVRYLEAQSPQDILAEEVEKVRGGLPLLPVRPIREDLCAKDFRQHFSETVGLCRPNIRQSFTTQSTD